MTNLELVATEKLVTELSSRMDCLCIATLKKMRIDSSDGNPCGLDMSWKGDPLSCIGMLEMLIRRIEDSCIE